MFEWIGWVATAVFAISYFCRKPAMLRRTQALAALLWIGYGVIIKAPPVIVANVVVAAMALFSSFQRDERMEAKANSG
ncbi:MAG: YgjV family protein [Acidobacteriota bacterium]